MQTPKESRGMNIQEELAYTINNYQDENILTLILSLLTTPKNRQELELDVQKSGINTNLEQAIKNIIIHIHEDHLAAEVFALITENQTPSIRNIILSIDDHKLQNYINLCNAQITEMASIPKIIPEERAPDFFEDELEEYDDAHMEDFTEDLSEISEYLQGVLHQKRYYASLINDFTINIQKQLASSIANHNSEKSLPFLNAVLFGQVGQLIDYYRKTIGLYEGYGAEERDFLKDEISLLKEKLYNIYYYPDFLKRNLENHLMIYEVSDDLKFAITNLLNQITKDTSAPEVFYLLARNEIFSIAYIIENLDSKEIKKHIREYRTEARNYAGSTFSTQLVEISNYLSVILINKLKAAGMYEPPKEIQVRFAEYIIKHRERKIRSILHNDGDTKKVELFTSVEINGLAPELKKAILDLLKDPEPSNARLACLIISGDRGHFRDFIKSIESKEIAKIIVNHRSKIKGHEDCYAYDLQYVIDFLQILLQEKNREEIAASKVIYSSDSEDEVVTDKTDRARLAPTPAISAPTRLSEKDPRAMNFSGISEAPPKSVKIPLPVASKASEAVVNKTISTSPNILGDVDFRPTSRIAKETDVIITTSEDTTAPYETMIFGQRVLITPKPASRPETTAPTPQILEKDFDNDVIADTAIESHLPKEKSLFGEFSAIKAGYEDEEETMPEISITAAPQRSQYYASEGLTDLDKDAMEDSLKGEPFPSADNVEKPKTPSQQAPKGITTG